MTRKDYALYYGIQRLKWEDSTGILKREDALRFVEYSPKILWYACTYNAPLDIVKRIYHLAPNQALYQNEKEELLLYDMGRAPLGYTPLMWMCDHFASENMNEKDCSDVENVLHFLLDMACSSKEGAMAATLASSKGELPLHIVSGVIGSKSHIIFRKLLMANPDAIKMKAYGVTPFDVFSFKKNNSEEEEGMIMSDLLGGGQEESNWKKDIEIFILFFEVFVYGNLSNPTKITYTDTLKECSDFPLHKSLAANNMNPHMISFFMSVFAEEVTKKDQDGNYPLHIALSENNPKLEGIVEQLLWDNKQCTGVPNKYGKTPLCLAIESGHSFESNAVQALLKEAPESISKSYMNNYSLDNVSKMSLYPFMSAATSDSKASINEVYQLLRLDPSLVISGIILQE